MKSYYLVNTNSNYRPNWERQMLQKNQIAAAYGPKEKIDVIKRGDIVFLYRNFVGIIAYGIADGKLIIRDFEGYEDEQHLMHVDRFRVIKFPIKPSEVTKISRKLTSTGIFYARTVSPLRPQVGEALLHLFNRVSLKSDANVKKA